MRIQTIHRNLMGDVFNECSAQGFQITTADGGRITIMVDGDGLARAEPPSAPAAARGEVVAWFPTNAQGEIIRNYGDGSPVYAYRTKEEAEQAKRCHLGATGPVIPLYAAPPPAAAQVDVRGLVALAEQMERDAAGCRRDGYIDAAVVKEDCAQRIRQTLGISAIAEALSQKPAADQFIATFRCENNGIVGTTDAKVHSVTRHDDGRIEVVIDHWPKQPAADCTCPHQDAREPDHDVACPARLAQQPAAVEGFDEWYDSVDARFWDNRDACNAAFHAGKRAALAQQPAPSALVGAEDIEVLKRLREALHDAPMNGWWLGVEVLDRVIAALEAQHQEPKP